MEDDDGRRRSQTETTTGEGEEVMTGGKLGQGGELLGPVSRQRGS